MAYQAQSAGAFLKGLVASNQPLAQPKGSFPRGSNLLMLERGAVTPCDGSQIINAVGGVVLANQGRFMSLFLYEPIGVNPYYLAIKQALDERLGAPHLVSATPSSGGSLVSGQQYFYVITALDGVGGETIASNELSATPSGGNLSVTLVWNTVPNAFGYNIYRATTTGMEVLQISSKLPVLQPNPLTATVTFIDNGTSTSSETFTATAVSFTVAGQPYITFTIIGATLPSNAIVGVPVTSAGFAPSTFNGSFVISNVPSSTSVTVQGGPGSGSATGALTTVGPASPTAAINSGGGLISWVNPTFVFHQDNSFATAPGQLGSQDTQFLLAQGYGFSIPLSATISGITVTVYRKGGGASTLVRDNSVRLLNSSGVAVGSNKAAPINYPTTNTPENYGGTMDLWGAAWGPADINSANFGVSFQTLVGGKNPPSTGGFVDFIGVTISYITSGGEGTLAIAGSGSGVTPPTQDTTQQTALFQMPNVGPLPISYSNLNIVALYPASLGALGQVPTGGSGGQGTTGPGISGQGNSTPSGGVAGLVGPLPQFKQFTNRVIIALGNGFPMQLFSDPTGSPVNPALFGGVSSVSVSGDIVTVTVGPTLTAFNFPPGSNVVLSGMTDSSYNGTFTAITTGAHTFTIRNPTASGGASTGTFTVSTTPIVTSANAFTPSFPAWTASTAVAVGDVYVPKNQPGSANIYIIATQAGITGSVEPTWQAVAGTGQSFPTGNIADGQGVIWQEAGYLSAPSPPGAGHIEVYAGSLWAFNTSPTDTANGLDGPTALRMSNVNDPTGWNSVNQAFLDKDDGAEGMGLGKFTITAAGIPPEGSLIAFKYRVPYQIIGVFGANNFAIQPVSSDMGCLAPRTIQFVPGFGLMRYCHLGIGVFNGYKDEVISEQIRPFLFPVNDLDTQDITVADANYIPLSWSAQTANPPMYAMAAPIGNSGGQLTRMFTFDLILKCWAGNVDLPFPIGCMAQVQPVTSNPLTIIGGFSDGCLQRWQAGDLFWYTGGGAFAVAVAWSIRTITVASQTASQRLWARKLIVRGTNLSAAGKITVQPRVSAVAQVAVQYPIPGSGDYDLFADVGVTGLRFDAIISGNLRVEIDGIDWAIEPRPFGVPVSAI